VPVVRDEREALVLGDVLAALAFFVVGKGERREEPALFLAERVGAA